MKFVCAKSKAGDQQAATLCMLFFSFETPSPTPPTTIATTHTHGAHGGWGGGGRGPHAVWRKCSIGFPPTKKRQPCDGNRVSSWKVLTSSEPGTEKEWTLNSMDSSVPTASKGGGGVRERR